MNRSIEEINASIVQTCRKTAKLFAETEEYNARLHAFAIRIAGGIAMPEPDDPAADVIAAHDEMRQAASSYLLRHPAPPAAEMN